MAFVQKTWKDRVAEYINRRILTKEDGTTELISVERSEGTISQEGDAFSAENMNDLEQRIANEFSEQNKNLFKIKTYVGSDGKLHFVDSEGADSVLNFSKKVTLNSVFLVIAATSGYGDQKASFTLKTNGCKTLKISGILGGITGASVAVTSGSSSIGSFTSYSQTTKTFDISKCTVITLTITRSGTLGAGTWSQFTGSVELY